MPQGDPQDDHPPEHMHGIVVAAFAASPTERVEQLSVGQGRERILDGLQGGAVFERFPIEERLDRMEDHQGKRPWISRAR